MESALYILGVGVNVGFLIGSMLMWISYKLYMEKIRLKLAKIELLVLKSQNSLFDQQYKTCPNCDDCIQLVERDNCTNCGWEF